MTTAISPNARPAPATPDLEAPCKLARSASAPLLASGADRLMPALPLRQAPPAPAPGPVPPAPHSKVPAPPPSSAPAAEPRAAEPLSAGALMQALRALPHYMQEVRNVVERLVDTYSRQAEYAVAEKPTPFLPGAARRRRKLSASIESAFQGTGMFAVCAMRDLHQLILTQHPEWSVDAVGTRMLEDFAQQMRADSRVALATQAMYKHYSSLREYRLNLRYAGGGSWRFTGGVDL